MINDEIYNKFISWYEMAKNNPNIKDHTNIYLSTSSKEGVPSGRVVLLKDFSKKGFMFFTNKNSRKGRELLSNPYASICIYWDQIDKQIRIEGKIEEVSEERSDHYFNSRHKLSRLGAIISKQSEIMADRNDLEIKFNKIKSEYENNDNVIRPKNWGGFILIPNKIEFWEDRPYRLHKRELYEREDYNSNIWQKNILYP